MKYFTLFFLSVLACSFSMFGQKYEFGDVSKAELESVGDVIFPEADAIVIYRDVSSKLGELVRVTERIKIFNEEGYEYATVRIPYPEVSKLKGATYNLVNGEVVKTKLDKDLVFTDEEIKGVKFKKFTFPKVAPGSVLEFSYQSAKGTNSDIDLQYDIPIKKVKVEVMNYTQTNFDILQNPRAFLDVFRTETAKTVLISAKNVPALEPESFVYDMNLYRSKITIKLTGLAYTSARLSNWTDFAVKLYEVDEFANNLKVKGFYKDDVQNIIGDEQLKMKQVELIYDYLKKEIEWDETRGLIPERGVRETLKKKKGDVVDINMTFISMLKSLGFEAYPVLVSTKSNGLPLTPSFETFNYVIAALKFNNQTHLFDAANPESSFKLLPESLINWRGLLIMPTGKFEWVDLNSIAFSNRNVMVKAELDSNLFIEGQVKEKKTGYHSIELSSFMKDLGENKIEDAVDYDFPGFQVSDVEVDANQLEDVSNLSYTFELENAADEVEGKLYISPLLFLSISENPFKKDTRRYPIDFGYPQKANYIVSIKCPEGYTSEFIPEPVKIMLPEDMGFFTYQASVTNNMIQVLCRYQLNNATLPVDKYQIVREFFKARIDKESEKIVLSKS